MSDFSTLGTGNQNIPFEGPNTNPESLGLTNPDSVLTGTTRGQQSLGAPNIKTDAENQRIIVNDNTTNRVSFGRIGTGPNDWGLKVSKSNFNVDTATADQLIFNSSQNVFKIVQSGTFTDSAVIHTTSNPGAGGFVGNTFPIAAIAHNLNYVPAIIAYIGLASGGYQPIPYTDYFSPISTIALWYTWSVSVDPVNVNITLTTLAYGGSSGIGGNTKFKYFLLQETAS